MKLDLRNKGLTTLQRTYFPHGITELDCSYNQLTSLQYCPKNLQILDCGHNQLTSFNIVQKVSNI